MNTQAEYNKLAAEEPQASMVEVPLAAPAPAQVQAPVVSRGSCYTSKCCCLFSAATGVKILATFDVLHGVLALLSASVILLAKTHEHAIDKALEPVALDFFNMTTTEAASQIGMLNHGIDVMAARAVPFILLSALCFFWVGHMGLKAAKGDLRAARFYYFWKVASAVITVFSESLPNLAFAIYFAVVVRSHYTNLLEASVLPTTVAPPAPAAVSSPVVFGNIQHS